MREVRVRPLSSLSGSQWIATDYALAMIRCGKESRVRFEVQNTFVIARKEHK